MTKMSLYRPIIINNLAKSFFLQTEPHTSVGLFFNFAHRHRALPSFCTLFISSLLLSHLLPCTYHSHNSVLIAAGEANVHRFYPLSQ